MTTSNDTLDIKPGSGELQDSASRTLELTTRFAQD